MNKDRDEYIAMIINKQLRLGDCRLSGHVNDKGVVLAAVSNIGKDLAHASVEMQDDKEIVLAAVKEDGEALQFASERLRDDFDVALETVRRAPFASEHCSERLRENEEIMLVAVRGNGYVLAHASDKMRKNLKLLSAAVSDILGSEVSLDDFRFEAILEKVGYDNVAYLASDKDRDDRDKMKVAVSKDGEQYRFVSSRLKEDLEIMWSSCSSDNGYFALKSLPKWVLSAVGLSEEDNYEFISNKKDEIVNFLFAENKKLQKANIDKNLTSVSRPIMLGSKKI